MALQRVWHRSPHVSSRGGAAVRLIVIHATEGATTYQSLGNWFANPGAQVSSHTGIDNTSGNKIGEYVKPGDKAWTAGNANGVAVQTELCVPSGASANWTAERWKQHPHMLRKCAEWLAEESRRFGIPLVQLNSSTSRSGRGVCQHRDLGWAGNDHFDCGKGFPIGYVINLAKGAKPDKPAKPKPPPAPPYEQFEVEPVQIQFDKGEPGKAPAAVLCVPNFFGDGKARLRLGCTENCTVRVDLMGAAPTVTLKLGYDRGSQGAAIPKGCTAVTVRRDSGTAPIDAVLSK